MQPLSGNQRPDLVTSLMNMSFVLHLPRKMHLCRSSSNVPCPPSFLEMLQNPHVLITFDKVHNPLRLPRETRSECPKVLRTLCVLYILTSKCASCHNGVHFFDIATSKSGPNLVCFVHFGFEMCFAPQRRALFRHLNFQKWSENGVLCTFWLRNVLRATTACTFRHLNFQKWSENGVLYTFWLRNVLRTTTAYTFSSLIWPDGSAPAALASLLFDPPEPQIIGKTQCFATFLPFRASASSFFWLFLFSDLLSSTLLFSLPLPISAFHLSILSEVWLLNFLRWSFIKKAANMFLRCFESRTHQTLATPVFPPALREQPELPRAGTSGRPLGNARRLQLIVYLLVPDCQCALVSVHAPLSLSDLSVCMWV